MMADARAGFNCYEPIRRSWMKRVVTSTPLSDLWDENGPVLAARLRWLSAPELAGLLRAGPVRLVVAEVGSPLEWVPPGDCYGFWKSEVQPHLADPDARAELDRFESGYCYFASEWGPTAGPPVVLLETHH
jgi:hypothetical protein